MIFYEIQASCFKGHTAKRDRAANGLPAANDVAGKENVMKVLALNGSSNAKGVTYNAIRLAGGELEREGIELEIVHVGAKAYKGCLDCRRCRETHRCVHNDIVNDIIDTIYGGCDGLILAAPAHYMGVPGPMKAVCDRLFYATEHLEGWNLKPACCIATCRRAGALNTFQHLNNYLHCSNLLTVNSQYWNLAFGWKPEEFLAQDAEGVQTLRVLGRSMAWALKTLEAGKMVVAEPGFDKRVRTNFCR